MTEEASLPTTDIRISEFAPDRDAATRAWADEQLRQRHERFSEAQAAQDAMYDRMRREEAERLTALRLEAVERGEVYVPPEPRPLQYHSASVFVHHGATSPWGTAGWGGDLRARSDGKTLHVEPVGRPVLLPPGFKMDLLPPAD